MSSRLPKLLDLAISFITLTLVLTGSSPRAVTVSEQVRVYTRGIEFDFGGWTLDAAWGKFQQAALGGPHYSTYGNRKYAVAEYTHVTGQIMQAEAIISLIYSDPKVSDPAAATAGIRRNLEELEDRQRDLAPLAEAILEQQVSAALAELKLTSGGQPVPSVLYHVTPLPLALIVSPRDKIQTDANISLFPDLDVEQQAALEARVDSKLNTSSLVVPIGGIGIYPTMVMQTTALESQIEIVAHEWIHNYLTLRPLGMNYGSSPELRTMNETAASLAGKEISQLVVKRYYPEHAPGGSSALETASLPDPRAEPILRLNSDFDYRAEMHATRLRVDELLTEGKIDEAESYMEERRRLFWDNGYPIRKLNQAYFAFYGAYADVPGGAAGEDPVGPAVVALRARSASLAEFLQKISWMSSFEELQAAVQAP